MTSPLWDHEDGDDPCTLMVLNAGEAQSVERSHVKMIATIDHLADVIRRHHADNRCPIYCWGEHARDDIQLFVTESMTEHLLYLACAKLAGLDIR